jgi:hypothetical protein
LPFSLVKRKGQNNHCLTIIAIGFLPGAGSDMVVDNAGGLQKRVYYHGPCELDASFFALSADAF